jgi:RNA ligase
MLLQKLNQYYEDGLLYKQVHPTLPLTIWNYTEKVQYENLWDEVTLMCRGLVTDDKGNIIARPFKKFFNIEEGKYTPTKDFEVYEKMDGSLGIVFNYNLEWIFATRGSFTSDQAIKAKEIFYKKYNDLLLSRSNTYLFEIIYPENRIVVDYGNEEKLVMLGEIHTELGEELDVMFNVDLGFDVVKKYSSITDYKQLKAMVKDDQEGFIVKFTNGDRIKIKGAEYLRLHKIMTNMSTTAIWECLKNGDDIETLLKDVPDEFYNKIKDHKHNLQSVFDFNKRFIECEFEDINNRLGQVSDKDFALYITDYEFKSFHFCLRKGRDIDQAIWKMIKPEFKKL